MDLLGDLGQQDQLTSVRAENALLQEKVKELSMRVKVLTVEKESLQAEVEAYREKERAGVLEGGMQQLSIQDGDRMDTTVATSTTAKEDDASVAFVQSGNGVYVTVHEKTLERLHGNANLLACALDPTDTVLATGGADKCVQLNWAFGPHQQQSHGSVSQQFEAPVICTSFSPTLRNVLAVGCMDGTVHVLAYSTNAAGVSALQVTHSVLAGKHTKYCKSLAWSSTTCMLAAASADGSILLFAVHKSGLELNQVQITALKSLHLPGAVEALCFVESTLICYPRDSPDLYYFEGLECADRTPPRKVNLNTANADTVTGGFDTHVSFCIMDLQPFTHQGRSYLVAATDTSRNLVLDVATGRVIRNLYGHANDAYATPKVAASPNGQYVYGNTSEAGVICVWDVASSRLVQRLEGHASPVRDLYSSPHSDLLVTVGFDKQTRFWVGPAE